jgi:hypothetical protein
MATYTTHLLQSLSSLLTASTPVHCLAPRNAPSHSNEPKVGALPFAPSGLANRPVDRLCRPVRCRPPRSFSSRKGVPLGLGPWRVGSEAVTAPRGQVFLDGVSLPLDLRCGDSPPAAAVPALHRVVVAAGDHVLRCRMPISCSRRTSRTDGDHVLRCRTPICCSRRTSRTDGDHVLRCRMPISCSAYR